MKVSIEFNPENFPDEEKLTGYLINQTVTLMHQLKNTKMMQGVHDMDD